MHVDRRGSCAIMVIEVLADGSRILDRLVKQAVNVLLPSGLSAALFESDRLKAREQSWIVRLSLSPSNDSKSGLRR